MLIYEGSVRGKSCDEIAEAQVVDEQKEHVDEISFCPIFVTIRSVLLLRILLNLMVSSNQLFGQVAHCLER